MKPNEALLLCGLFSRAEVYHILPTSDEFEHVRDHYPLTITGSVDAFLKDLVAEEEIPLFRKVAEEWYYIILGMTPYEFRLKHPEIAALFYQDKKTPGIPDVRELNMQNLALAIMQAVGVNSDECSPIDGTLPWNDAREVAESAVKAFLHKRDPKNAPSYYVTNGKEGESKRYLSIHANGRSWMRKTDRATKFSAAIAEDFYVRGLLHPAYSFEKVKGA